MRTRQVVFLRAYAVRGIITDGLRSAGVNRNTYYHWRENDPWFKAVAAEAEEARVEAEERLEMFELQRTILLTYLASRGRSTEAGTIRIAPPSGRE